MDYRENYISLEQIARHKLQVTYPNDYHNGWNDAIDEILECQPADVKEIKRGNWIIRQRHEHYPSGKAYNELVCPFCKRTDHNGDGGFCGYCGAILEHNHVTQCRSERCPLMEVENK